MRRSSGNARSASRAERSAVARRRRQPRDPGAAAAPARAGIGERDQMPGEIAAVDRRDVGRLERAQVARVVPVVEMAAEALEPAHRRERRLEALDGLERADPAEIARRDRREQVRPILVGDVRWATTGVGILLEVVRRQHVVRLRDEGLEEAPGPARDQPQRRAHRPAEIARLPASSRRQADPARDRPATAARATTNGAATGSRAPGPTAPDEQRGQTAERDAAGHLAVEARASRCAQAAAWTGRP